MVDTVRSTGPKAPTSVSVRKRIQRLRLQISEAILKIADQTEVVRLLGLDPETFLRTCGVLDDELIVFNDSQKFLRINRKKLCHHRVSLSAMKALVEVDEATRDAAMARIATGAPFTASDVRSLEPKLSGKSISRAQTPHELGRERLISAATRKATEIEEEFVACAKRLYRMMDTKADGGPISQNTHGEITVLSGKLLSKFESLFGFLNLAPAELPSIEVQVVEERYVEAHRTLRELSTGNFGGKSVASSHVVLEPTPSRHLWPHRAEESIGFLAGEPIPDRPIRYPADRYHQKLNALELCAGIGGQALGLHAAGFTFKGMYEIDEISVETLKANCPGWRAQQLDIKQDLDALISQVTTALQSPNSQSLSRLDVISGALPWEPWNNKAKGAAHEEALFDTAKKIVEHFLPRSFFFQTVSTFTAPTHLAYASDLIREFNELGYHVQFWKPIFGDFGIPLKTSKWYLVGVRHKYANNFCLPKIKNPTRRTVADVLLGAKGQSSSSKLAAAKMPKLSNEQISHSDLYKNWRNIGKTGLAPDITRGLNKGKYVETSVDQSRPVGNVEPDGSHKRGVGRPLKHPVAVDVWLRPLQTVKDKWIEEGFDITRRELSIPYASPKSGPRTLPLTPGILAKLQGLPIHWRHSGVLDAQIERLLESTPPIIAYVLASSIRAAITGVPIDLEKPGALAIDFSPFDLGRPLHPPASPTDDWNSEQWAINADLDHVRYLDEDHYTDMGDDDDGGSLYHPTAAEGEAAP